ncbi:sodium:calcium antiporter [Ktedonobacter racemifer]|uniref:Sodium/calcium exchanger membrane region n=1 Tax=Ktedonobacter racemifer DSM 44963 TaxID=485913 RepID=D6TW14_KTERA|nr:sodium:calcium antiporter [Ktedonobacter racemifer]EFH84397.1 sodium/calcium exchanger membrane region [Ktedonobacter racemifer DSM 44963]
MLTGALALLLLGIGTLALMKGADWFMDGVGDVARQAGISLFVLGIILAGLEPEEMLTAAIASSQGNAPLALGNILGNNFTMITIALGLSAILFPIVLGRELRRQAVIATLISLLPIGLLLLGNISRLAGLLLLLVFVGYTWLLLRIDRQAIERFQKLEDDDDDDNQQAPRQKLWRPLGLVGGGLLGMALGGPAIVWGAEALTQVVGLSQHVIGATLVSLATASEMIALGIAAARKRQSEVLVGGVLGSFAYNLLVTLGLAALVRPLPVDLHQLMISLPAMILAHLLLLGFIWRGRLRRLTGAFLLVLYAGFILAMVLTGHRVN